jgi:hypothetical protein
VGFGRSEPQLVFPMPDMQRSMDAADAFIASMENG